MQVAPHELANVTLNMKGHTTFTTYCGSFMGIFVTVLVVLFTERRLVKMASLDDAALYEVDQGLDLRPELNFNL